MTTLERHPDDVMTTSAPVSAPDHRPARTWLIVALVAIVALVVGGAIGWFVGSEDDPQIVLSGSGELTERQLEMVDFMDDYVDAWQRGDGEAVAAMYTSTGRFVSMGTIYRVEDGSLAELIDGDDWGSLTPYQPNLVKGNELIGFHSFPGSIYVNHMVFTNDGELRLLTHTVTS